MWTVRVLAHVIVVATLTCTCGMTAAAQDQWKATGREILKELIETDTTHSSGSTTLAAERIAARLTASGFEKDDIHIVGTAERKKNLVVRLRGRGTSKPLLFIAHLDVVEARREDWSMDPFVLNEQDGYFYGRGTLDVKGGAATLVASFARLKEERYTPERDLILALTADEEGGADNGIRWLLEHGRDLVDAEYCINVDSGGGELHGGKMVALDVQAAEKVFTSFTLTVRNSGGHSSLPVKENAIYRLAAALQRLSTFEFPLRTNEVTRAYFAAMAPLARTSADAADMRAIGSGATGDAAARLSASSPFYNALLRTTCVATLLTGGHAENALPQLARATVNCRMLPDDSAAAVQQTLEKVVADPKVLIESLTPAVPSPSSPLKREVFEPIQRVARTVWGEVPIVPFMETGATDGLWLRNAGMPVYGVSGIPYDVDDVRAHGKDERILVRSYWEGLDFIYGLLRTLGAGR
jgi:acetylornithine deacetylase/succinyl-diaminopimelate desuccinylase-like protein